MDKFEPKLYSQASIRGGEVQLVALDIRLWTIERNNYVAIVT
jgi:hypothetical protein